LRQGTDRGGRPALQILPLQPGDQAITRLSRMG
jgi:hypothetical protein